MSHSKQFTLFSTVQGPNGWKVAIVLDELGLTYETKFLDFSKAEQKAESFTKYNPNGRIPALIDHHNNDFIVWESNAIIQYLVDKYDPEHKLSVTGDETYAQLQWLFFQSSGQGPYFGQLGWFILSHPEKVPSAIERYQNEIKRVLGVLNGVLSKQDWLVGNKLTVADLSFIPWNDIAINFFVKDVIDVKTDFPALAAWHAKLGERPSVQAYRAERQKLLDAQA